MHNQLTLAVAGGRKTQMVAERCASLPLDRRVAVITYTQANQQELQIRIAKLAGGHLNVQVMGWFTFLLRHFARPFLPLKFSGLPIPGFRFEGDPDMYAKGSLRFVDANGDAYRSELPRLAFELLTDSRGAALHRIECLFDEILIDEVQDFCGYDLDLLETLFDSSICTWLVGDVRQAVLSTNPKAKKNKKFRGAKILDWFQAQEKGGKLEISHAHTTWRCCQEIATYSDGIFDSGCGYPKTHSENFTRTGHDGVFLVHPKDVAAYVAQFAPQCLRDSSRSAKSYKLAFINFGAAKGSTHHRVLIMPTKPMEKFITEGGKLTENSTGDLYVAVTRAAQSVAIVLANAGKSGLSFWQP